MNEQDVLPEFHSWSYQRHADNWQRFAASEDGRQIFKTWFDESTADYWRHRRMYEAAECLGDYRGERWLTIGDGQFGLDSVRLQRRGVKSALPTDIADVLLREAKEKGIISDFRVENAEKLSFEDDSFDFVFCKEAYHHFPRPYLALYEMLRVARRGIVLVEPQDHTASMARRLSFLLQKAAGRQQHSDQRRYEDSGNYIYSVSRREFTKAGLGLNLPCVAFKGLSDLYVQGVEFEPASLKSRKYLFMRAIDLANDIATSLRLSAHNVLMSCIFKQDPPKDVKERFFGQGWDVVDLPKNPYAGEARVSSEPHPEFGPAGVVTDHG